MRCCVDENNTGPGCSIRQDRTTVGRARSFGCEEVARACLLVPAASCVYRTKEDRTGQDSMGEDRRGQDRTGQDKTGRDRTGEDRIGLDRTGQDST